MTETPAGISERHTQKQSRSTSAPFSLAALFEFLARRQEGQAVTSDDGQQVDSLFSQPITACIDFLSGVDSFSRPIVLIGNMATAFEKLRKSA